MPKEGAKPRSKNKISIKSQKANLCAFFSLMAGGMLSIRGMNNNKIQAGCQAEKRKPASKKPMKQKREKMPVGKHFPWIASVMEWPSGTIKNSKRPMAYKLYSLDEREPTATINTQITYKSVASAKRGNERRAICWVTFALPFVFTPSGPMYTSSWPELTCSPLWSMWNSSPLLSVICN